VLGYILSKVWKRVYRGLNIDVVGLAKVCVYVCVFVCVCVYLYIRAWVYVCVCVCVYMYMCVCVEAAVQRTEY